MSPKRIVDIGSAGQAVRQNLASLRAERGLTAQQLSDRMDGALSRSAISDVERGARRVDVDDLIALAAALAVSPSDLFAVDETDVLEVPGFGTVTGLTFMDWTRGATVELLSSTEERTQWLDLVRKADERLQVAESDSRDAWSRVRALGSRRQELIEAAARGELSASDRDELAASQATLDELTSVALGADRALDSSRALRNSTRDRVLQLAPDEDLLDGND